MADNPATVSTQQGGFWDIGLADLVKDASSVYSSMLDRQTAVQLAQYQKTAIANQTPNSIAAALSQPINITEIAAFLGVLMILGAGGVWLLHHAK